MKRNYATIALAFAAIGSAAGAAAATDNTRAADAQQTTHQPNRYQPGTAGSASAVYDGRQGVEAVRLNTATGPVTVISRPVSGNISASDFRIDFSAIDENGNGYISRSEARSNAGRSQAAENFNREFHVADRNNDGRVNRSEVSEWIN